MPTLHPNYWPDFVEFVKAELATCGPDPFLDMLVAIASRHTEQESAWLAGCYAAHHCTASGYVVFKEWPLSSVCEKNVPMFRKWLQTNWAHLPVRPEMRSHRMLEKRLRCLLDFADYAKTWPPAVAPFNYETLWKDSLGRVKYYGRYMAIKYLELLGRMGLHNYKQLDLRARGAWSPRRTLAMLWPNESILADRKDTSKAAESLVETYAAHTVEKLAINKVRVDLFQVQVLLCEFREALNGGYYAGQSLDEDLAFMLKMKGRWPRYMDDLFVVRKQIFHRDDLGELNNWTGVRKDNFTLKRAGRF